MEGEENEQIKLPKISIEEFAAEFFKDNNFATLLDWQLEVLTAVSSGKVVVLSLPRTLQRRRMSELYQKFQNNPTVGYFDPKTGKAVISEPLSVVTANIREEGCDDIS